MARTNRRTSLCSDEQAHFYVSIFTYDPASIARTVFRTPSNRIVKRISTPTRRKISLVDDKKKKKGNRGREISNPSEKSAEMIHARDFSTSPRNYPIRKLREKATTPSFIIEHSFFTLDRGRKDERGRVSALKIQGGSFTPLTSSPTPSFHGPRISPRRAYIYPIGIFGIYHETSLHPRRGGNTRYPLRQGWIGCARRRAERIYHPTGSRQRDFARNPR